MSDICLLAIYFFTSNQYMDPYKILNINSNSTKEQIRKAYLKAVIENHPDNSSDPNAEENIRNIYAAYQILINDNTRNIYNNQSNDSKHEYYDKFKKYIDSEIPNFSSILEKYIEIFYGDKNKFFDDLNDMNFDNIYKNIMEKIPNIFEKGSRNGKTCIDISELDINGQVYTTIKNKYMNKYEKISVNRITKDPIILHIPLRNEYVSFLGEGESVNNLNGSINIRVVLEPQHDYTIVENDLYCHRSITLYEYLYGGTMKLKHIDDEYIDTSFKSFVDEIPLLIIKNKGMPYIDHDTNVIKRGKLYVKLSIRNMDLIKDKVHNISENQNQMAQMEENS